MEATSSDTVHHEKDEADPVHESLISSNSVDADMDNDREDLVENSGMITFQGSLNEEEHIDLVDDCETPNETKIQHNQPIQVENEAFQLGDSIERIEVKTHTRNGSSAEINSPKKEIDAMDLCKYDIAKSVIDTAAPFESVKEAVSMFGGIVDWKAHRLQTVKRRKLIERELEKVEEEIVENKKQAEISEKEKMVTLKELDTTKREIEEVKLALEQAEREEHQAKQDSALAKLRQEEIEQGITDESSYAAKAQLEVAKARHASAVSDLESAKSELESLDNEYTSLIEEKETAVRRAEDAIEASKQAEKKVEELTIELIATKEGLESAHAARLEAEEHRIGAAMAREQDNLAWEKELKQMDEAIENVERQIEVENDLKLKYDEAIATLASLKVQSELYMSDRATDVDDFLDVLRNPDTRGHAELHSALVHANVELEKMKLEIKTRNDDISTLQVSVSSLESEIDKERSAITVTKQREAMASIAVASLEAEVNKLVNEIASIQSKEREARERMIDLPRRLQQAAKDADDAKSDARTSQDELRTVTDRADHTRALLEIAQSRLHATEKEIEAAKVSEKLALEAIKALSESDGNEGVVLSLEEYYELSKRANEAEEKANMKVANALSEIDAAKAAESGALRKLEEANDGVAGRKEELRLALDKAEKAKVGKLGVEQELRKWRSEHEQRRRSSETSQRAEVKNGDGKDQGCVRETGGEVEEKVVRKKRSFFPRILMFLARRKVQASKSA